MQKRSKETRTDTKIWSKEVKNNNVCYRKDGRVITKWRAIEKNKQFDNALKTNLYFRDNNDIFVDCTYGRFLRLVDLCAFSVISGVVRGYWDEYNAY